MVKARKRKLREVIVLAATILEWFGIDMRKEQVG